MRVYTRPEATALAELLEHRLVFLDGAMGTMLQGERLSEADFRGDVLRAHPSLVQGNFEVLCLTQPQVVERVHREVPGGGRRHPADQHLQRQSHLTGRIRPGGAGARAEPGGGGAGAPGGGGVSGRAAGTAPCGSRGRWGRRRARPRCRPTWGIPRIGPSRSINWSRCTGSRRRRWLTAGWTCCCSRRASTR